MDVKAKLVPTEGCYQKEKDAILLKQTRTEITARAVEGGRIIRFKKVDGMPVLKYDRGFPCYKLVLL